MRELDSSKAGGTLKPVKFGGLLVAFLAGSLCTGLQAQQSGHAQASNLAWQTANGSASAIQSSGPAAAPPESFATIAGTVQDSAGASIPAVRVKLLNQEGSVVRVRTSDSNGAFAFDELLPGTYRVTMEAPGLEPFASSTLFLTAGQRSELPIVSIRIPTTNTTVDVTATLNQVAQAQVQQQEKQRILGFLPNYYTSYIWNAVPMSRRLKFSLALRTTIDPVTFVVVGAVAGAEQWHKTFPGYGQGLEGYAKRYGASYADVISSRMFGSAIFPVILHQDPRYFYRGSGSTSSRIRYALMATIVCRGDNGRLEPNYSRVFGSFAAAGLSNVYRASADRQASLTFRNGLIIIGTAAVENLLREFLSRKLTPNVPAFANGKP